LDDCHPAWSLKFIEKEGHVSVFEGHFSRADVSLIYKFLVG